MNKTTSINVRQLSTGFIEVPGQITLNIYAQGCEKRCPGCQNIESQSFEGGMKLLLSDIDSLVKDFSLCKWVCWLGGDAVYQPESFKLFNAEFASRGFKIALYTGRDFKEVKDLLDNVSLVIDGEWKGKTIKDSGTNQNIWYKDIELNEWSLIGDWNTLDLILNLKITGENHAN